MSASDLARLAAIVLCHVLAAFFAGMETGVTSLNRLRLLHRARNGSSTARVVEGYLRDTDRLLATALVWGNIVNVVISTLAGGLASRHWGPWGQTAAAATVSVTVLVFGEYLPKAWFYSRPLERCLPLAHLFRAAEFLVRPIGVAIMAVARWILPRPRYAQRPAVSRENIARLVRESEAKGQISAFERLLIDRVLALQLQTAADIMTPLSRVSMVHPDTPLKECGRIARESGHLKLPVFDGGTCAGILRLRGMLARAASDDEGTAAQGMVPPFFVDAATRADDVLPLLRARQRHMAIVRDAAGVALGILTVEDCLGALVDDIPVGLESDRVNRTAAPAPAP